MATVLSRKQHPLENGCPPHWASVWGQDQYGVWVEFQVQEASQRMRWIMPGRFRMGSPDEDGESTVDEKPAHEVVISRGFWMFDTPCCQDLWEAVMGSESNGSRFRGPRRPAANLSWEEAVQFAEKLNKLKPGLRLRLPRESEWEYACRAGSVDARYGKLEEVGWYEGNSGRTNHDVAEKLANRWGLYDMLGNVWEWCLDWQRKYSHEAVIDPDGGAGPARIVRGGSSASFAVGIRAAYRFCYPPSSANDYLGFRCLSSGIEE